MNSPVPAAPHPGKAAVVVALALVYLIWGSTYLGIRFALQGGWPPMFLGGFRFIIGGGLMFAFLRWRGVAAPTRAQWKNAAVMGALMLLLGNGMVNVGETIVPSGIAAVMIATVPLWMGIFAALRGQHPRPLEWLGMAIGFAGVLWLNAGNLRGTSSLLGYGALLLAAVAWSFGSVWVRGRDVPAPLMMSAAQMLCGGMLMVLAGICTGEKFAAWPSASGIAAACYLLVFGSLVAFSAYVWLLHNVRPALVGSYAYVNPVIAVLLGAWLAHEQFDAHDLAAMALIVVGVVVITLAKLGKKPA